jgi:maltooligosyltrehalose trehalohydrolase
VTSEQGFGYHSQWNDDLNHAVYARLTGETWRHYQNFGGFDDVVKALTSGFVYDGTRFDRYYGWYVGTDGRLTTSPEHVVHIQNHDQIGNRLHGDRMLASHGRDKALLAITTIMASPFVPMLFMGEEYGETAPFYFFEDFSDQFIVDGCRAGRKADFAFGGAEPPDPHARSTFEASKLQWSRADSAEGVEVLAYYKTLIDLKKRNIIGPRDMAAVTVEGDASTGLITITTAHSVTALNFSDRPCRFEPPADARELLADSSGRWTPSELPGFAAAVLARR